MSIGALVVALHALVCSCVYCFSAGGWARLMGRLMPQIVIPTVRGPLRPPMVGRDPYVLRACWRDDLQFSMAQRCTGKDI